MHPHSPADTPAFLTWSEAGELRSAALKRHLQHVLTPVAEAGADVIGLSCTHYPLVRGAIKRALGPGVRPGTRSRILEARERAAGKR